MKIIFGLLVMMGFAVAYMGAASLFFTFVEELEEDFNKTKEAVEKQKAMKPTGFTAKENVKIGNATWRAGTTIYHCPRCYGLITIIYKHCPECGQKIDWTGVKK